MKRNVFLPAVLLAVLIGSAPALAQFGEDFGMRTKSGRFRSPVITAHPDNMQILVALPSDPGLSLAAPISSADIELLRQKLEERTTIELDENDTFETLFSILKEKYGIQAIVDPRGAGALGITTASPVVREPFRLENVPLRRILQMILSEQDLTYVIDEGFLQITSEDEAKKYMKIRVYPVADLVFDPFAKPRPEWVLKPVGIAWSATMAPPPPTDLETSKLVWQYQLDTTFDFAELMDLLEATVSPDSWDEGGEMMEFYPGLCLVVRQTDQVHDEIDHLLVQLRAKRVEPEKKMSDSKSSGKRHTPPKRHQAPRRGGFLRR